MTPEEKKRCDRFTMIRKELNLKQKEFARQLRLSQGHVSDIENQRKAVSTQVSEILSLKYSVNEDWLMYGEGEAFSEAKRDIQIRSFFKELEQEDENSFRRRFMAVFTGLNQKEWKVLENICRRAGIWRDPE